MRLGFRRTPSRATAAILAVLVLLPLPGCAIPPSGIPTEASIRGLRPSGTVTMTQVFVSASGVGGGGLGAISTLQASGEVYRLKDVSQFSGPWIQGTGSLAVIAKANGEIWLENRNGIIMPLNAAQAGLTFSQGRCELYIQLSQ
jgi:hypothetical protein